MDSQIWSSSVRLPKSLYLLLAVAEMSEAGIAPPPSSFPWVPVEVAS